MKIIRYSLILLSSITAPLVATEVSEEQLLEPKTLSNALGHTLAKSLLETTTYKFDVASVVQGMQDELAGKPSPLTESQYEHAFDLIHKKYMEEVSTANLDQANFFLNENLLKPAVVEVIPGRLQMEVLEEGDGEQLISNTDTPVLKYSGRYLDDTQIQSIENESIPMNEAVPGLKEGLIGAKKGEVRRLYIHPEFESIDTYYEPLMILDVTVLEVNQES